MRLIALVFILFAQLLSAQNVSLLDKLSERLSDSCLEMEYSYTVRLSGINNSGKGNLQCQGYMWKMVGNGVEMYCDSASMWVVDPANKEVVIESAIVDDALQLQVNPAVLFVRMKELMNVRESRSLDQKGTVLYILSPKRESDIEYFNVEMAESDLSIKNSVIALKDGTLIKIEVSSMKLTPVCPVEKFRPQTIFDSSWIVTDLR